MKKKILPFLFSLCLLAGCGEKEKEPAHEHTYGDWSVTKQATCKEAGSRERKCTGCDDVQTEAIEKLTTHSFGNWDETAATCKVEGKKVRTCTVCGEKEEEILPKLTTHNYVDAADQTDAVAPTCKDTGTVITECSVCGVKSTRVAPKTENHDWGGWSETTPASHTAKGVKTRTCNVCGQTDTGEIEKTPDHVFDETAVGTYAADHDLVGYSVYNCAADNVKKIVWDANEVDPETKNNKYNNEDNYKVDNTGIKFGGRPINNACALGGWGSKTPVLDTNVPGAFIEYKVDLKTAMSNVTLCANMAPNSCPAGLFLEGDGDWYPGIFPDATAETGYKISTWRYVIEVNGNEVELDPAKNVAAADATATGWYNFPCTLNLNAGVNTIKLIQAGGWEATFYEFGLISSEAVTEVVPAASEGFAVGLTSGEHVTSFKVYEDRACTVEETATSYVTRNEYGRPTKDGSGEINFEVEVEAGFQVKEIKFLGETAPFDNIKFPPENVPATGKNNVYRIKEITGDCNFEIVTEPDTTVYEGFTFTFVKGEHITKVEVYSTKSYIPGTGSETLTAVSLDETTLRPTKKDGQIYIMVYVEDGYVFDTTVEFDTAKQPFKNLKGPADTKVANAYRFTKVNSDATITLKAKAAE